MIAPTSGLVPEVAHRISQRLITHVDRNFLASDLDDPAIAMVLTAVDDPAASSSIYTLCKRLRIPVNIADVPAECDFYFGSVHRDGPLQVMVSTNGNGPKLANVVRRQIAAGLPVGVGEAVALVGALRKRLRVIAPAPDEGVKRMEWMSRVCEAWSLEELGDLDEADMEALLKGYNEGVVVGYRALRGEKGEKGEKGEQAEGGV